ncbi:MAG TPA: transcriptional regulator [Pyrinomonadaceae bacterium]|nr:transcriptional regulator [Pyrinomonadaceae bacterium]
MQKLSHQTHCFDEFVLDLTRGCLLHGHEEIKLRPKSFEVLRYLVENNGRLISKDELIHAVWVGMAVTDDSLVQCLKDIRHALGDQAQQIIKTVHGRGYIFDTEVRDNGSTQVTTYTEETAGVQVIIEEEETNGHGVTGIPQLGASDSVGLISPHRATRIARLTTGIKQFR